MNTVEWANEGSGALPRLVVDAPGPRSRDVQARMERHAAKSYGATVGWFPIAVAHASGTTLTDVDGNVYLDFASGGAVTNIGHAHPKIAEAIGHAAHELDSLNGFATPHRVEALEKLASVTPSGMTLVGLHTSLPEARRAAMGVACASTGRHWCANGVENGAAASGPPAGIVWRAVDDRGVERPIESTRSAADHAREVGALLIVEESGSSFGRFGSWFSSSGEGLRADLMVLGREIGNGFPVAAIVVREEHADALDEGTPVSPINGDGIGCAAVDAVIDVLQQEQLVEYAADFGEMMRSRVEALCDQHPLLGSVQGRGASYTIELASHAATSGDDPAIELYRAAFSRGLATLAGPGYVRVAPPIVITAELFAKGLDVLDDAVSAVERQLAVR